MSAIGPADIWAVGGTTPGLDAISVPWDGVSWAAVPTASVPRYTDLTGVSAAGPGDVWAVGSALKFGSPYRPIIEHYC